MRNERTRALIEVVLRKVPCTCGLPLNDDTHAGPEPYCQFWPDYPVMAAAVTTFVDREREACALVAEDGLGPASNVAPMTPGFVRRNVADAIRAREYSP